MSVIKCDINGAVAHIINVFWEEMERKYRESGDAVYTTELTAEEMRAERIVLVPEPEWIDDKIVIEVTG